MIHSFLMIRLIRFRIKSESKWIANQADPSPARKSIFSNFSLNRSSSLRVIVRIPVLPMTIHQNRIHTQRADFYSIEAFKRSSSVLFWKYWFFFRQNQKKDRNWSLLVRDYSEPLLSLDVQKGSKWPGQVSLFETNRT